MPKPASAVGQTMKEVVKSLRTVTDIVATTHEMAARLTQRSEYFVSMLLGQLAAAWKRRACQLPYGTLVYPHNSVWSSCRESFTVSPRFRLAEQRFLLSFFIVVVVPMCRRNAPIAVLFRCKPGT